MGACKSGVAQVMGKEASTSTDKMVTEWRRSFILTMESCVAGTSLYEIVVEYRPQ